MATSFAQQPHNIASNAVQYSHHRPNYSQSAAFTPPSSITPPAVSPTGNHLTSKQLSSARHLGYLPAALRPTELGVKTKRPLTPPRSAHSSVDSQSSLGTRSLPITPIDDYSSFMQPLGSISRVVTDEWNEELGEVTGAPTRGHWKPDSAVTCCASATCSTVFSFLARRHHCRRCGGIYCTSHSARLVPLDQEARFHPQGGWVRSCDNCWGDYQIWQHDRKSRASSVASSGTTTPPAMVIDPDVQIRGSDFLGIKPKQQPHNPYCPGNESVGGADWNWSTF